MYVSLYGLALGAFFLVTGLAARFVVIKALDRAAEMDAGKLTPAERANKLRMRNVVAAVLNVEVVALPVIGYAVGHFVLDQRLGG